MAVNYYELWKQSCRETAEAMLALFPHEKVHVRRLAKALEIGLARPTKRPRKPQR